MIVRDRETPKPTRRPPIPNDVTVSGGEALTWPSEVARVSIPVPEGRSVRASTVSAARYASTTSRRRGRNSARESTALGVGRNARNSRLSGSTPPRRRGPKPPATDPVAGRRRRILPVTVPGGLPLALGAHVSGPVGLTGRIRSGERIERLSGRLARRRSPGWFVVRRPRAVLVLGDGDPAWLHAHTHTFRGRGT